MLTRVKEGVVCDDVSSIRNDARKRKYGFENEDCENSQKHNLSCDDKESEQSTVLSYSIYVSHDYGPNEKLVDIKVFALGGRPSENEAVPIDILNESVDEEHENHGLLSKSDNLLSKAELDCVKVSTLSHNRVDKSESPSLAETDQYIAWVDPDLVTNFLRWTSFEINEVSMLYFLMTFPFYEEQWDLVGYLFDCVFGDMDDDTNSSDES